MDLYEAWKRAYYVNTDKLQDLNIVSGLDDVEAITPEQIIKIL